MTAPQSRPGVAFPVGATHPTPVSVAAGRRANPDVLPCPEKQQ